MAKYMVRVREVHIQGVEVEADSPEEAVRIATSGEEDQANWDTGYFEYSHILEPDTWDVLDEDGQPARGTLEYL